MTRYRDLFTALAAQFEPSQVRTKPGGGNRQLSYVTARTIMNRLDEVLGPENWWDDYDPLEKCVICRLTIRLPDGATITKSDAGGFADMADVGDGDKSGYSDALKRAAVKFGVSRYLYGDGVARLTSSAAAIAATPEPEPPAKPAVKPGSEDAQGRGGKLVYGAASAARPKLKGAPKSGMELHYYATDCAIDPNLENWIINTHNPQGYPDRLINWTPADVARALPSIREHLETVKAARARMKASA